MGDYEGLVGREEVVLALFQSSVMGVVNGLPLGLYLGFTAVCSLTLVPTPS